MIQGWDAAFASGSTVILANSPILPAGEYTIDEGKTLLVPYDEGHKVITDTPDTVFYTSFQSPTPYRTLTMANGANITVNGTMTVPALYLSGINSGSTHPGRVSGGYGHVHMEEGSSIAVNGVLSTFGYITGEGTISANSGAAVYESFQVTDFCGGGITVAMNDDKKAFPFTQYYVQNIEVPITFHYGATEKGFISMRISSDVVSSVVEFISSSGSGMFNLTAEGSSLTKRYESSADRLIIDTDGKITVSSISLTIKYLMTTTVNSSDFELPITSNMTLNLNSGEVTVGQNITLLPGSEIYVGPQATLSVGQGVGIYAMDSDHWGAYCFVDGNDSFAKQLKPLHYFPSGSQYTRTEADLKDAKITVAGKIDVSAGGLYTTDAVTPYSGTKGESSGGAAIIGIEGGQVIMGTVSGTSSIYFPASFTSSTTIGITSYTVNYDTISAVSAKLLNGDNSYTTSASGVANATYTYSNGKWVCGTHSYTSTTTATCTAAGTITYTCSVCGDSYSETAAALGHNYTNYVSNRDATCTADGTKTATCDNGCGTTDTVTDTGSALGHNWSVSYSWSDNGNSCTATRVCGNDANHVETATATITSAVKTAPTCTTMGTTTYTATFTADWAQTQTKDVVDVAKIDHNYESVVTDPTCTEGGYTTYTCSCGDSYKAGLQAPTGEHKDENSDSVCDVCGRIIFQEIEGFGHSTNVELGNSLNMYFAFWGDNVSVNDSYYAKIICGDVTQTVAYDRWLWTDANGDKQDDPVVYFAGLSAKQMSDIVTVELYNGSGTLVATWCDSIRDYALRLLDKYDGLDVYGDTDKTETKKATLLTLLVDMLNYGAECQTYFNYNKTDLANRLLTKTQKGWGTQDTPVIQDKSNASTNSNSANLITESNIQFAVAFTVDNWSCFEYSYVNHWRDGDDSGYMLNDQATTGTVPFDSEAAYYTIPLLVVADARQEITIKVYDASGEILETITDSIEAYCARMIEAEADSADVCVAFMKFSDAAENYLESEERL